MENSTIAHRIDAVIKALGITQSSFARQIGFTSSSINSTLHGKSNPKAPMINQIISVFNVNRRWLEAGELPMFLAPDPNAPVQRTVSKNDYLMEYLSKLENKWETIASEKDSIIQEKEKTIEEKVSTINNLLFMIDFLKGQLQEVPGKLCVNEKESAVLQMEPTNPVTMQIAA